MLVVKISPSGAGHPQCTDLAAFGPFNSTSAANAIQPVKNNANTRLMEKFL
jgi:hypothetical protein